MQFDDNLPIYLQLRQEIEKAIITGAIAPDEMLPSIRVMAKQYRLNPNTVSNAVSELLNEGYLYKKRGIGMFVSPDAPKILRKKSVNEFKSNELKSLLLKGKSIGIEKNDVLEILNSIYPNQEGK